MKKFTSRIFAMFLAVLMICSMVPMTVFADEGEVLFYDEPLSGAIQAQKLDTGSIEKWVGETGLYQRLPRLTNTCMNCWNILREITPDAYYGCSYELNNPDILKNCSFTSGSFAQSGFHEGLPCLQFNYEAAKPGTTTVKLKFYYRYDAPDESGYCDNRRCGAYVECPSNYNSYYDTVTFSVTVTGEEITIKYIDGTHKAEQKGNAGDSFTIKNALTSQTGKEFLGWSETANAESAEYEAGKKVVFDEDTTLYAVWADHVHTDGDGDGICDTDNACMHEKDANGNCTKDSCTHPDSCCLKVKAPTDEQLDDIVEHGISSLRIKNDKLKL